MRVPQPDMSNKIQVSITFIALQNHVPRKGCKKENQLVEDLQLFLLFLEARLLLFFVDDSTGLGEAAPSLISFESGSCSKVFCPSKHTIRSPSWHKFNTRAKSAVIYYELSCNLNKIATATGNGLIAVHYLSFQVIYLLISQSQSSLLPGSQFRQSDVRNNDSQAPASLLFRISRVLTLSESCIQ